VAYNAVVAALSDALNDDGPEGVAEAGRACVDAVYVWFKGGCDGKRRRGRLVAPHSVLHQARVRVPLGRF